MKLGVYINLNGHVRLDGDVTAVGDPLSTRPEPEVVAASPISSCPTAFIVHAARGHYIKISHTPRSGNTGGTNNLPPLLFHQVHGDNIRISRDGTVARRAESFCKGVTFSSRPVKIAEKVCVKFLEVSNNWSGVVRFGFTCNDPNNLRYGLPKYVCPDLTNKPGYWAKALAERFAERDTILFYYVTATGDVHFGINGEEKGVFFSGVETRGPLWAVMDVYGNSTAVELVDTRQHLNNAASRPDTSPDAVDRIIVPSLTSLSLQQAETSVYTLSDCVITSRRTRGRNVRLSNDRCIASRIDTEFCHGYVFTGRPILLGEKIVLQVVATEPMYMGALAFGLTSCDPATLQGADLPDDCDVLLDRQEYWVVSKDVAGQPQRGEVQFSKNGCAPVVFMHVDQTLQMWAFWDVYGCTQKQWADATATGGGTECTICYERPIDSVLYMCGHMCMCYECAVQQWRGKGGGHCPLCRAIIRDVIRTYKS
uniref:Protein neuralized n=1 Tax=Timema genevievae TaxID=629358 RepID=A0A7R9K4I4_TIMGE|nr:unnamed protein product [Timema genevievae]